MRSFLTQASMSNALKTSQSFLDLIHANSSEAAWSWFQQAYAQIGSHFQPQHFGAAFAGARRRLGHTAISVDSEQDDWLPPLSAGSYQPTLDIWGRICLLLRATESLPPEESTILIHETYARGDNHERQAIMRGLPVLPDPVRYLSLAVEACRTNVRTVFESIACHNTYPFDYFADSNFNQMVLKALFIGSSLKSIVGLQQRQNPQLHRMARDFASERQAAGRPVPEDIALINLSPESEL